MTVTTTLDRVTYQGNGATTIWSFSFVIPDSSSLAVILVDPFGNTTTLSSGVYSVSGLGSNAGGSITYPLSGPPLPVGWTITIRRSVQYTQKVDLTNQDNFYPEVLEAALDNLEYQIQQLVGGAFGRAPLLRDTDIDGSGEYQAKGNWLGGLANAVADSQATTYAQLKGVRDAINARIDALIIPGGGIVTVNYNDINHYSSKAALAAGSPPDAVNGWVETAFYAHPDDDGGALYEITGSAPGDGSPATSYFATANAKYARLREKVLRPAHFGIYNSNTDNAQGIADMVAEIIWRGGCRVEWDDNKTFNWLVAQRPTPTVATDFVNCMSFTGLNGFRMMFNGSKIVSPQNFFPNGHWPGSGAIPFNIVPFMLRFENCKRIVLGHPWFEQTNNGAMGNGTIDNTTTFDPYSGMHGLQISNSVFDFKMIGIMKQRGGAVGIEVVRDTGNIPTPVIQRRGRGMDLAVETSYCFYGGFFERSGDDSRMYVKTDNVGRSAGAYGVSNVEMKVDTQGMGTTSGAYDDCLFTADDDPSESFDDAITSNIRCHYKWRPDPASALAKGTLLNFLIRHLSPGSPRNALLRNIHVTVDFDGSFNTAHTPSNSAVIFGATGAPAGGYNYMDNIKVDGWMLNMPNTPYAVNIGLDQGTTASDGSGTVDYNLTKRRNICIENLMIESAGGMYVGIDGTAIKGLRLASVDAPGSNLLLQNMPAGVGDFSSGVNFNNFTSAGYSSNSGWKRLPDGQMTQWGVSATIAAGGNSGSIAFTIPFRAAPSDVQVTPSGADTGSFAAVATATGITIYRTGGSTPIGFYWRVTGQQTTTGL